MVAVFDAGQALGGDAGALGKLIAAESSELAQLSDAQSDLASLLFGRLSEMRRVFSVGESADGRPGDLDVTARVGRAT